MFANTPIMRMRWRHLLFAHWPIDASALRPLVPPALEIDTLDGGAWVGLIPFTMTDVSPRLLPRVPLRGVTDFHECNVRTYVYPRGRKDDPASHGVWFFSLDAASRIAVWGARRFFHLPYFNARMSLQREEDVIDYSVERIPLSLARQRSHDPVGYARERAGVRERAPALRCRWRALEELPPSKPGDLAHFLTERYCLYAVKRGPEGVLALHRGHIAHTPWPLRRAEVLSLEDSLVRAAGVEVDRSVAPVLYHADELDVRAWWLERA